jgi:DNA-binding transcriptional MerR regulator
LLEEIRSSRPAVVLLRAQHAAHPAAPIARLARRTRTRDTSPMSAVRTNTAAAMLGVSPSTLRSWEQRYGYPLPRRSAGGHRQFELEEIEALREALARAGGAIAPAVELARTVGRPTGSPLALREAFAGFDAERCDEVLEQSLALRSLERSVCELLLESFATLEAGSPEQGFAWRYATGWLAAALRVAPPAQRPECVLIFDCGTSGSLDALQTQALELLLRRRGLRALALSAEVDHARVGRAVRALDPAALVLAGRGATLDQLGRLVYAARQAANELTVYDFRGAMPETGASTVARLGAGALAACETLSQVLAQPRSRVAALG